MNNTEILRLIRNLIRIGTWLDTHELKKKKTVTVKRKRKSKQPTKPAEPKENAARAAKANWEKIQRGVASFSIQLAVGRADLYPEMPVTVSGFKPEIDNADWTLTRVVHSLNDSGFTSALELEVKISDLEIDS
nr:hypothetical protein [Providencia stuartii]